MRRILVAVDDSEASERVVAFVNEFFRGLDVEVIGISVASSPAAWVPTGTAASGWFVWPYPDLTERSGDTTPDLDLEREHAAQATVESSGLHDDETIAEVGDPVVRIREAAIDHDVDLIVIGTSHKGWWRRMLEGSVSAELQRDAPRPVLLVQ